MTATETAMWFHLNIVCRYGVPITVRVDRGTAFRGDFATYCAMMGIHIRVISVCWARAAGQVEVMNRTLKGGLRKLMDMHPNTVWSDWLGEALWAMRSLIVRPHGFTPFRLVFKQEPQFP
jgi:hypothetical protein